MFWRSARTAIETELSVVEQFLPARETNGEDRVRRWAGPALASDARMAIHHVTIAVRGRQALARDETERRALVRRLARVASGRLMLFNLVDDHFHAAARDDRPGVVADALRRVLKARRSDLQLKSAHLEPVGTRAYTNWLVGYILGQSKRHGLGVPTALWTGSCFQDLVGARLLPGFDPKPLRAELPRLGQPDLLEAVGLDAARLEGADDEALERAGAARIVELAMGVHCVGPVLADRSSAAVQACALAAQTARLVDLPLKKIARFLGRTVRAVEYLAGREVDPKALAALRRRLTLEQRVAAGGQR